MGTLIWYRICDPRDSNIRSLTSKRREIPPNHSTEWLCDWNDIDYIKVVYQILLNQIYNDIFTIRRGSSAKSYNVQPNLVSNLSFTRFKFRTSYFQLKMNITRL
ncbi:hypothetical protein DVH24_039294 [Malus domestica]|uniref:Uncharacterized protein n=1 Tax=Malus domestica TaxID=3750 RepID=A0A498I107_MALDO|nr:hypothetical protein DVH24_039294 [Malus domestica]